MARFTHVLALAPLVLAACQQRPAPSPDSAEPATTAPTTSAPAPDAPTAAPTTATAIPDRFRGVWDAETGSCNAASDLRLEIAADRIEFYESVGTVGSVTVESPDRILVDLAMEGEGEKWTVQNRYALSNEGKTLTPSNARDDSIQPIPRKRCPA